MAYFVQCLTDRLYPEMGTAIVKVLRALGATVTFPRTQHCCGLPAHDGGSPDIAQRMARQTIETLEGCECDYIVSGGTSCVITIKHDYPHLFRSQPEWRDRAARLGTKTFDFTTFLSDIAALPAALFPRSDVPATYHYFCQSYNVLKFREQPLTLLRNTFGIQLVPLPEANVCCGFGGSVSLIAPEVSGHIMTRKLENIDASGVPVVITDNPGCIMHLRGGMTATGRNLQVLHIAEVMADRIDDLRRGGAI